MKLKMLVLTVSCVLSLLANDLKVINDI